MEAFEEKVTKDIKEWCSKNSGMSLLKNYPNLEVASFFTFGDDKNRFFSFLSQTYSIDDFPTSPKITFLDLIKMIVAKSPSQTAVATLTKRPSTTSIIKRPSAEEERRIVKMAQDSPLEAGKKYYIVDVKWMKKWKLFIDYDNNRRTGEHPGEIDNYAILKKEGTTQLKESLFDELHYVVLHEDAWNCLYQIYGGGPEIPRLAISIGLTKRTIVEVYPLNLKIVCSAAPEKTHEMTFSKSTSLKDLKENICKILELNPEKAKLFQYFASMKGSELKPTIETIDDAGFMEGQRVLIEIADAPLNQTTKSVAGVPGQTSEKKHTNFLTSAFSKLKTNEKDKEKDSMETSRSSNMENSTPKTKKTGLVGLRNLGNTCFMNSGLQCLSNTPFLLEFFLSRKYKSDINKKNPLGMKGQVAEEFASLMEEMWSSSSAVAPTDFKKTIGKFAPQFSGFSQHDSQELLAFLLDGLHEDLNRVKEKPYIQTKDYDDKTSDKTIASELWSAHTQRNNSIIVDLFQGQYKSKLVCPKCSKVSVMFDPFMYLSLPIPFKEEKTIRFTVVHVNGEPLKYATKVPKSATIADLKQELFKMTNIDPKKAVWTEVYMHKFHKAFQEDESVSDILPNDEIFAYEHTSNGKDHSLVQVFQKVSKRSIMGTSSNFVGYPFVITVNTNCTMDDLVAELKKRIDFFITIPDPSTPNGKKEKNVVAPNHSKFYELKFIVNGEDPEKIAPNKTYEMKPRKHVLVEWDASYFEKYFDERKLKQIPAHSSFEKLENPDLDKKNTVSIYDCLDLWSKEEKLSKKDAWYCPSCKKHKKATKKLDLWKLPDILVIHLKRFSYANRLYREKIDLLIDFPTKGLDLSKLVLDQETAKDCVYDLFAVSNHFGGLGGGHYTAFCKNRTTNKWYDFDDSSVSTVEESSVRSKSAYVLLYCRRNPNYTATLDQKEKQ